TGECFGDFLGNVEPYDRRSPVEELGGAGSSDSGGGAGDQGHLAGHRWRSSPTPQLGLFQVPVLDVEQLSFTQGPISAQVVFGMLEDGDRVVIYVGGDVGVSGAPSG